MGLQSIHKENICHRDIKLENILLDENYNPKLCDFGLSDFNKGNLIESVGTINYAAPEILEQKPYNGFKIDIFSLGVTLLTLVTGSTGFSQATASDFSYFLIKNGLYEQYWNAFGAKGIGLSEEFKKLYFKMVSYNPENRPTIDEILNSGWMKEIKKLNEEKIKKIENEIRDEFISREILIKEQLEHKMEIDEDEVQSSFLGSIRSGGEDIKEYFTQDLRPKIIQNEDGINNFVKIKGNLNPVFFMNKLVSKIYDKFENNCYVKEKKYSLKFNIIFNEEENNDINEEIPKDILNDLNKL